MIIIILTILYSIILYYKNNRTNFWALFSLLNCQTMSEGLPSNERHDYRYLTSAEERNEASSGGSASGIGSDNWDDELDQIRRANR